MKTGKHPESLNPLAEPKVAGPATPKLALTHPELSLSACKKPRSRSSRRNRQRRWLRLYRAFYWWVIARS